MKCSRCGKKAKMTYDALCYECYRVEADDIAEAIDAAVSYERARDERGEG